MLNEHPALYTSADLINQSLNYFPKRSIVIGGRVSLACASAATAVKAAGARRIVCLTSDVGGGVSGYPRRNYRKLASNERKGEFAIRAAILQDDQIVDLVID